MSINTDIAMRNARRTLDNAIIDLSDDMDKEALKGKVWKLLWFFKGGQSLLITAPEYETEEKANEAGKRTVELITSWGIGNNIVSELAHENVRFKELSHWIPIPVKAS